MLGSMVYGVQWGVRLHGVWSSVGYGAPWCKVDGVN